MAAQTLNRRLIGSALFFVCCLATLFLLYGCGAAPGQGAQATVTVAATMTEAAQSATGTAPAAASSPTVWVPPTALQGTPIEGAVATLTAAPPLKRGVLTFTRRDGQTVSMGVEIADTEASRELGLMFRESMPPDDGMLFVFEGETESGFWMGNTILPLSIAFVAADGTILNTEDMQPLDTSTVQAAGPYRYAIEANQGYYRAHGIQAGDRVTLPSPETAIIPGMPAVGGK